MSDSAILSPADAADLEARGLVTSVQRGRRSVSNSVMNSEDTVSTEDSGYRSETFEIPENLESMETLEYMGYTEDKAKEIWEAWLAMKSEEWLIEDDLGSFAVDLLMNCSNDAWGLEDDWYGSMQSMGVSASLQQRIMEPEFEAIRCTHSVMYWVKDTMELRYLGLLEVQKFSKQREARIQRGEYTTGSGSIGGQGISGEGKSKEISSADSSARRPRTAMQDAAKVNPPPGFTILWKAIDEKRVRRDDKGKIFLSSTLSSPPSDFHGTFTRGGLYLAVDKEIAQLYGQYSRKRQGSGKILMLKMEVPNDLIKRHNPSILNFDETWKELIWTCRRGNDPEGELKRFRSEKLIIGPICRSHNKAINKLESWKEVNLQNVLTYAFSKDGGKEELRIVKQYVWQSEEALEDLGREATWEDNLFLA